MYTAKGCLGEGPTFGGGREYGRTPHGYRALGNLPSFGGGREYGRDPRGYRALGQWDGTFEYRGLGQVVVTISGKLRYFSGSITEGWRKVGNTPTWCETCESYKTRFPNSEHQCRPAGTAINNATGESQARCYHYIAYTNKDLRPGFMGATGDKGWGLYVADLIPTTGGTLPGWARLQGNVPPNLKDGDTITLQGSWIGTPPNNLGAGTGWDFNVEGVAGESATPTPGHGAIDQNAPEMIDARIEASGIQAERQALAEGATPAEAQEIRQRTVADLSGEAPAGTGEAGPLTVAGFSPGAVAAVIVGGMFILPLLSKKGRKARGGGGVQRWGI